MIREALLLPLYFLLSSPMMATELILSCPHEQIPFKVELAQTPQEHAKGLMNRNHLGQNEGMLFLFPEPHPISMWMKNTSLSLDMLFMNQEGNILAIVEKTTPYSLKLIGPVEDTTQVLELTGGTVKKHRISKACHL